MTVYYSIMTFIFGTVLGSFYNVCGYRLPREESLIKPPSHCPKCNHRLGVSELIPILSYLFQFGKCKNCKAKISLFYPIFETTTGLLFMLSYLIFGFSIDFFIAITFISMLLIIIISDYQTMIIPDSVLVVASIMLIIELFIKNGVNVYINIFDGIISFMIMFLLKKLGDFLFKKESMGGGDIKLMGVIGLVLNYKLAIITIFLASIIGLPISLLILFKNKTNIIPFGPFLSISAIILLLSRIDFNMIIEMLTI
ncbi:MAG: prepilin peptidase [Bacilli bacterium]|nr:prepilin peptidase [Bacilli bacterium]